MNGKVEITLGAVQIKCEGSESFLEKELPKLLDAVADFYNKTHEKIVMEPVVDASDANGLAEQINNNNSDTIGELGMNSICSKLNVESTRDVALAAAVRLKFVKGKATFSRNDILGEMKKATDYFEKNMRNNLTKTLRAMVRADVLKENKTDSYSIAAATSKEMRAKFVQ